MRRTRELAARQNCTISTLVESGLRLILDQENRVKKAVLSPLPQWRMGEPLIDIADRDALSEVLDS